jgi:hypothetical protein
MRTGSCLCGGRRFELAGEPRWVGACHCINCRRAQAAGAVPYAGYPREAFTLTSGSALLVRYSSDTRAVRTFCGTCGTTFLDESPRWADEVHVLLATVDEPHGLMPRGHAYADRAPEWAPISTTVRASAGRAAWSRWATDGMEPLGD